MAIVVEEEPKSRQGFASLITWGIIFVIVGVAIYYVFFKNPALVEQATPTDFANIEALSKIDLKPDEVINSPSFLSLKVYAEPVAAQAGGRSNPFFGNF